MGSRYISTCGPAFHGIPPYPPGPRGARRGLAPPGGAGAGAGDPAAAAGAGAGRVGGAGGAGGAGRSAAGAVLSRPHGVAAAYPRNEIAGQRVRLHGIDATEALRALVDDQPLHCTPKDVDLHRRVVARCEAGGRDIGAEMVRQGWAMASRRYSTAYVAAERRARTERAGIWSGEFVPPWDWRHGARLAGPQ